MQFQTLIPHKANGKIALGNGHVLAIDAFGCLDVTDPSDIAELESMPGEWSRTILAVPARGPVAGVDQAKPKTAVDLVADMGTNDALASKLAGMRSAITRRSWLESLGYRFTDAELDQAITAAAPKPPAPPAPPAEEPAPAKQAKRKGTKG